MFIFYLYPSANKPESIRFPMKKSGFKLRKQVRPIPNSFVTIIDFITVYCFYNTYARTPG